MMDTFDCTQHGNRSPCQKASGCRWDKQTTTCVQIRRRTLETEIDCAGLSAKSECESRKCVWSEEDSVCGPDGKDHRSFREPKASGSEPALDHPERATQAEDRPGEPPDEDATIADGADHRGLLDRLQDMVSGLRRWAWRIRGRGEAGEFV